MPPTSDTTLRVFIVNVGQADTSVIVTPMGRWVVIDAYRPQKVVNLLSRLGLHPGGEIECLLVTHPHNDHYLGASRLVKDYRIRQVILAPFWHHTGNPGYHSVVNAIHDRDIPVRFVSGYERIPLDANEFPACSHDVVLELIGPSNNMLDVLADAGELTPNHLSIMARLVWKDFAMVYAADAQMENWAHFDHEGMLKKRCSVLKAAHHGSCRGTQWERLERLSPECVIVSSDPTAQHHLPDLVGGSVFLKYSKEHVAALTSSTGTVKIEVETSGSYRVHCFGDDRIKDVDLGQQQGLTLASNPTDWPALVTSRLND